MFFFRISRQIPEKSDVFCFFNQICENKLKSCRKFWNLWELFTIFQNYSLVSLGKKKATPEEADATKKKPARADRGDREDAEVGAGFIAGFSRRELRGHEPAGPRRIPRRPPEFWQFLQNFANF